MSTIKQGWLAKRGRYNTSAWKNRYYILQGSLLMRFDDQPRPGQRGKPKHVWQLNQCTLTNAERIRNFCFCLRNDQTQREVFLVARSEHEMRDWMSKLAHVIGIPTENVYRGPVTQTTTVVQTSAPAPSYNLNQAVLSAQTSTGGYGALEALMGSGNSNPGNGGNSGNAGSGGVGANGGMSNAGASLNANTNYSSSSQFGSSGSSASSSGYYQPQASASSYSTRSPYAPSPYSGQAPTYVAPTYGQPQQTYGQPQQSYGQPQQTYGQPQQTYGQPQQSYGQPQQSYGQPQQSSGQPQQSYGQPQQSFGQPQQSSGQPQQSYGQPQQSFGQPQQSSGQPQQQQSYQPQPQSHTSSQQSQSYAAATPIVPTERIVMPPGDNSGRRFKYKR